jgi:hypothetical protein
MSFPELKAKKDLINVYQANKERKRKIEVIEILETITFTH